MSSIVDELQKLMRSEIVDCEHDCTADEVARAICSLLAEIILVDDGETDKLDGWEQEVRKLRCTMLGGHVWEFDHCGYWGHKFCIGCNTHKYPELGKLRCSEAIAKIGNIKESEYVPQPCGIRW